MADDTQTEDKKKGGFFRKLMKLAIVTRDPPEGTGTR